MSTPLVTGLPPWLGTVCLVAFFAGVPLLAAIAPDAEERRTGRRRGRWHG